MPLPLLLPLAMLAAVAGLLSALPPRTLRALRAAAEAGDEAGVNSPPPVPALTMLRALSSRVSA